MEHHRIHPALAWSLVSVQLGLLAALVFIPAGDLWMRDAVSTTMSLVLILAGALIAIVGVAGLGRSLTASPTPRPDAQLTTTGIYAWVRHPIYTGLLIAGAGLTLAGGSVWHIVAGAALLVLLMVKARLEEWMLLDRYPDYEVYAAQVGRLLPCFGRIRP